MPTPFMHLALARRLMHDPTLPDAVRQALGAAWGPFLLGSIAPDARVSSGMDRAATHFFEYRPVIDPPPATAMLRAYPVLRRSRLGSDTAHLAFVAGYAAHLAMDAIWCTDLLFAHFNDSWGTPRGRWYYLHMLLGTLDQRDRQLLPDDYYNALAGAKPSGWLPFIPDPDLGQWRDLVANQLAPGAASLTLEIFGARINMRADEIAARMDDADYMAELWQNIPLTVIAEIERRMDDGVRRTLADYFEDREDRFEAEA